MRTRPEVIALGLGWGTPVSDYIQLAPSDGSLVTAADGGTLFQGSDLSYGAESVTVTSSGRSIRELSLDPLSFTLGSGAASQALGQALASGSTLQRVVVYDTVERRIGRGTWGRTTPLTGSAGPAKEVVALAEG